MAERAIRIMDYAIVLVSAVEGGTGHAGNSLEFTKKV